jgi:hypothetical protein
MEARRLAQPGFRVELSYPAVTPGHRPSLEERFGPGSVSALTERSVRGMPAWTYSFKWDEGERSVLLVQVARETYRLIYDPRSELNGRAIATLSVVD